LHLPLKNASAGGGSLGLRNVARALQRDRQRGVGERVGGRDGCECEGGGDGWLELPRIAQGAHKAVVGFNMRLGALGSGGDGSAESLGCFGRSPGGEQIKGALVQ
jgi:hypothetical protein